MTSEELPNENVQAALDYLNEWTYSETKLIHQSGDHMIVKIDLSQLWGDEVANLIEWLIQRNWTFDELKMKKGIAKMSGTAFDVE